MRPTLGKRMAELVNRIDARHLRLKGYRRQREVGIAASVSQDLHFRVDTAEAPARRVCQRPIAVNKAVLRLSVEWIVCKPCQAFMLFREHVSKCFQLPPRVLSRIRPLATVMQMDLNLAITVGL